MKNVTDTRILLVEDDEMFKKIMERRLATEGYQVKSVADGREGMKAIVTWDPDVVISDWMMPHVDGLELCRSVKTGLKDAAPYFILLTAREEMTDRLLATETGADDYLVKPCDHGEILTRIRTGLRIIYLKRQLEHARRDLLKVLDRDAPAESPAEAAAAKAIPYCGHCQRVEAAPGAWESLVDYVERRRLAAFDHVACPACPQCAGSGERAA